MKPVDIDPLPLQPICCLSLTLCSLQIRTEARLQTHRNTDIPTPLTFKNRRNFVNWLLTEDTERITGVKPPKVNQKHKLYIFFASLCFRIKAFYTNSSRWLQHKFLRQKYRKTVFPKEFRPSEEWIEKTHPPVLNIWPSCFPRKRRGGFGFNASYKERESWVCATACYGCILGYRQSRLRLFYRC